MPHRTSFTLNYQVQLAATRETIRMALMHAARPIVSTKFTEESAVLLHLVTEQCPDIPVVWVDTGYNTRATRDFADRLCRELALSLHTFQPTQHVVTLPPALDDPAHTAFTQEVKIEPFQRALRDLHADAWLSSIRRYQSTHRSKLPVFDITDDGTLKVLPMLDWSADMVERYRETHGLPKGPACFDPTKGEPFRECGLHLSADDPVHRQPGPSTRSQANAGVEKFEDRLA